MTTIVDVLFDLDVNFAKTHHFVPANQKNSSLPKPSPKTEDSPQQYNQRIISGLNQKYDLLLETKLSEHQTAVEVFLISKFGQILKTNSDISRIELLQRCINEQEFYRPLVNPITGFLYFKLDFFNLAKTGSESQGRSKVDWILKRIDIEKLISSIKKIEGIQKSEGQEECEGWYEEEHQLKLSLAKAMAVSLQNPNVDNTIANQLRRLQNKQNKLRNMRIQYIQRFVESPNQKNIQVDLHRIRQSVKEIQKTHPHLTTFIKKKNRRINFDPLYVSPEIKDKLNQHMKEMCVNNIEFSSMKVFQESYGNVTLKLEKLTSSNFEKRLSFFKALSKSHEYDHLEKYFDSGEPYPIQISLESKGDNLEKFLQKNGNVMSLETKMRILVQIYTFVNVLWEQNQLVFLIDNLRTVLVTKRLGVKMRGLDNFFKSEKQMIWEDFDTLNEKRSESILNLSSLFFKMFYRLNLLYTRPKILTSTKTLLFDECKLSGIQKMNTFKLLPKQVTGKTKALLTSLNYIFSDQVYTASKTIRKLKRKEAREKMRKESNFMKARDLETTADCSDEDSTGEDNKIQGLLSTRHVNCWLLKNI